MELVGPCKFMHHSCMDLDTLILELLDGSPITDHGDLLARLAAKGHELTQSTLSRRLKRLGQLRLETVLSPPLFATSCGDSSPCIGSSWPRSIRSS